MEYFFKIAFLLFSLLNSVALRPSLISDQTCENGSFSTRSGSKLVVIKHCGYIHINTKLDIYILTQLRVYANAIVCPSRIVLTVVAMMPQEIKERINIMGVSDRICRHAVRNPK